MSKINQAACLSCVCVCSGVGAPRGGGCAWRRAVTYCARKKEGGEGKNGIQMPEGDKEHLGKMMFLEACVCVCALVGLLAALHVSWGVHVTARGSHNKKKAWLG